MSVRQIATAVTVAAVLALVAPPNAFAQTPGTQKPATQKPAGPKRAKEFLVGGIVAGPSSAGSASADLLNGAGDPSVTLFRVDNKLATGFGLEANIGVELRKALWIEITGAFTRQSLNSEIRDDFEDAADETISSGLSRFALEGAVVKYFREKPATSWFVRASGGWMRETAGGNTLAGDGVIAHAGLGWRRWFRSTGKGAVKRTGLRLEGRATIRSGGISLGREGIRVGPSGAAHFVFGF